MTALHRQADHFCPFGVMPAKDRVNRAKGEKNSTTLVESYEMLFDSGPLISVHHSLHCSKLLLSPLCDLPVTAVNLPFTHILLSTSLSCCAMVAQSLLFPAAMKTPRLFKSGVHHSIQLNSQNRVFLTAAPLKRLLTVPDELKISPQEMPCAF